MRQAQATKEYLKGMKIGQCYSSNLPRAQTTASIILADHHAHTPVNFDPRLREQVG